MDSELLKSTYLFNDFSDSEILDALSYLDARRASYKKGEVLISLGRPIAEFAIMLSGSVQISCDDINGNQIIMMSVSKGGMFAESLAVTKSSESPIVATATDDSELLWLKADPIRKNQITTPLHSKIITSFITALANKCLSMNDRVQILSKKSIRDKVVTYFSQLSEQRKSKELTIPLSREDMASYLGVERSALSRELSNMKRDGIIDFHKNHFKILH